jgi:hypothetical protein
LFIHFGSLNGWISLPFSPAGWGTERGEPYAFLAEWVQEHLAEDSLGEMISGMKPANMGIMIGIYIYFYIYNMYIYMYNSMMNQY